jgi:hypothetical protein
MDIDRAIEIARDPFATRHELAQVAGLLADEVAHLWSDNQQDADRVTLGGIPPAITSTWGNRDLA